MTAGFFLDRLGVLPLVWGGATGVILGAIFLAAMVWRRMGKRRRRRGILAAALGFPAVLVLMVTGGFMVALGSVIGTYHHFTREKPVAEITTRPIPNTGGRPITLVSFHPLGNGPDRYLLVRGDQWMIEADIVKWKPWLNLLGLRTRYRLTRLQGRYLDIETERSAPRSLFSLIDAPQAGHERHPFWRFLYRSGQKIPLVDTVYGNAAYQNLHDDRHYQVFVGTSGLIIRALKKGKIRAAKSRT